MLESAADVRNILEQAVIKYSFVLDIFFSLRRHYFRERKWNNQKQNIHIPGGVSFKFRHSIGKYSYSLASSFKKYYQLNR